MISSSSPDDQSVCNTLVDLGPRYGKNRSVTRDRVSGYEDESTKTVQNNSLLVRFLMRIMEGYKRLLNSVYYEQKLRDLEISSANEHDLIECAVFLFVRRTGRFFLSRSFTFFFVRLITYEHSYVNQQSDDPISVRRLLRRRD